ncbi:MAG: nucleoside-diphosphate kinase [Gordonia sp. (in: high G+C Gram-positive bacteria)]
MSALAPEPVPPGRAVAGGRISGGEGSGDRSTAGLLAVLGAGPDAVRGHLRDTYVLEAIDHLDRAGVDPVWFADRHSLLLLKPDAIVGRCVDLTLRWLAEHGWRVVGAVRVPAQRHLARALWAESWATASPERRRLADLLVGICDALLLVVTDREVGAADPEPAAVRLTREKGPTAPAARAPGQLRHLLGQHSYLLNLVHTPDTRVDVLREWAIDCDERARSGLLADLVAPTPESEIVATARSLADELYAAAPAASFSRAAAVRRIVADLRAAGADPGEIDPADDVACADLVHTAWASSRHPDPWSVIVVGSYVLPMTTDPTLRRTR